MKKKTIEEYREEVAVRPHETHAEYRKRVGRQKRHAFLMASKPKWWEREEEVKEYKSCVQRVVAKVAKEKAEMLAKQPTFREKQIAYDEARGAYRSRTFLEGTLRMKGIEPEESIEDMLIQYEEWKTDRDIKAVAVIATEGAEEIDLYPVVDEEGWFDIDEEE